MPLTPVSLLLASIFDLAQVQNRGSRHFWGAIGNSVLSNGSLSDAREEKARVEKERAKALSTEYSIAADENGGLFGNERLTGIQVLQRVQEYLSTPQKGWLGKEKNPVSLRASSFDWLLDELARVGLLRAYSEKSIIPKSIFPNYVQHYIINPEFTHLWQK